MPVGMLYTADPGCAEFCLCLLARRLSARISCVCVLGSSRGIGRTLTVWIDGRGECSLHLRGF